MGSIAPTDKSIVSGEKGLAEGQVAVPAFTYARLGTNVFCLSGSHYEKGIIHGILTYWKPSGELRLPQLMILLGAYRVVKIHN